jgi:hypothetical protein
MKYIKVYVAIMSVMLLFALGSGVYVWYTVQTVNRDLDSAYQALEQKVAEQSQATPAPTIEVPTSKSEESVVITVENMTTAQQAVFKTFGSGGSAIIITEEMVTCAKAAVGTTRFTEIINGSAPTPLESSRLLLCVK